uniref:Uncharacterized protein n=1 Tax=Rhizophora mucronata TaxID=61149 RepID=A0A2P2PR40_RHIMU
MFIPTALFLSTRTCSICLKRPLDWSN